jgi:hypothetical protein
MRQNDGNSAKFTAQSLATTKRGAQSSYTSPTKWERSRAPASSRWTRVQPCERMTRADYRTWAEQQPHGRFQRIDGVVVAMAPEPVERNDRKMQAWFALRRAAIT